MIKQLKHFAILLIFLFIASCNSQNQTKSLINKVERIKYGAGNIVTKGYLGKSGNMWYVV